MVGDIERLEAETGFSSTLGILVQANNVYDQRVIDLVDEFTTDAEARDEVVTTSSLVNTMSKILTIEGAGKVVPTEADIYAAGAVMPDDIRHALVHTDAVADDDPRQLPGTATQVNLRLAPASLEERAALVDELEADLQSRIDALDIDADSILLTDLPEGQPAVRAVPAGLATVGIGLLENLSANRAALTYLALSLAGLYLVLRTRSLGRALLALVPVFLAIGVSSLVVWALDITLSPLTTVSGPLVVASVAEFSVLIMARHIEERQQGLDPRTAVDTAARRTGRAFFTSALTTTGGFAVLISSSLPLLRDFGIIVTINVAIALLAALTLMPPMLVWADEHGLLHVADQVGKYRSLKLAAELPGPATPLAAVGAVAFAGGAIAAYATADTAEGSASSVAYAPATTSTTTTTTTSTTTTTTTTLAPGETAPPAPESTAPAGPVVDPSGFPSERPSTPVAGLLFDQLVAQGVAPNVANCGIQTAYAVADEAELLAMGIATPTPEALAIVEQGARDCGISQEQIDGAIAAQFPGYTPPG